MPEFWRITGNRGGAAPAIAHRPLSAGPSSAALEALAKPMPVLPPQAQGALGRGVVTGTGVPVKERNYGALRGRLLPPARVTGRRG